QPAVRLRGLADDRETETGARQAARPGGAVEAVEDVRDVLLPEARPVVADREHAVREVHLDLSARRAPLDRVVDQVHDRALDLGRRAADERRLDPSGEADARRPAPRP